MNVRPYWVEHLPALVRPAREPVNRLRSLHHFEFLATMRAKIVFNQRANAQVDGQQAVGLNAGLSQPGEGNSRSVARRLATQIHRRVNTPSTCEDVG